MSQRRVLDLLEKCEGDRLSQMEECELSTLLEDPSCRAVAEGRLSAFRRRAADLQAYREALDAREPALPGRVLSRLMNERMPEMPSRRRPKVMPFPRWRIPFAVAAMAAGLALVFWMSRTNRQPAAARIAGSPSQKGGVNPPTAEAASSRGARLILEFGVVTGPVMLRGGNEKLEIEIGESWRISAHRTRAELEAWSNATLPAGVQGRIWIDEEAGIIRGVSRRIDGSLVRREQPVDIQRPIREQLASLARRLAEN